MPETAAIERVNILGVGVSAIDIPTALERIGSWIDRGERRYVCVADVNVVMHSRRDPAYRTILHRAGLVAPDGMPLVWLCHRAGHRHVRRVYGPDLMLALCERSLDRSYGHYLYGGTEEVLDRLALRLEERYPGLRIVGRYAPPFRPLTEDEDREAVERINRSGAEIVWVGLGAPKQERWMAAHLGRLDAPVMLGVGAAFDFHSGAKPQAPSWIRQSGLEWLFRMASEPRRLAGRYLRNNPLFLWSVLLQTTGWRRFPLPSGDLDGGPADRGGELPPS